MIINLTVDVKKLDNAKFFAGKNGALYANITLLENRDGEDQYGNHFMAVQSTTKEEREAGKRGAIVGNAKIAGGGDGRQGRPARPAPAPNQDDSGTEPPF